MARLLPASCLNLLIGLSALPDFPNKNGPDDFAATKAIAAAADISVTAVTIRNCERR